ncbi:hypothetical protein QW131_02710 [Roseibium salinum]|nr:hypothetical protein [Roseibium salinum]
MWRGLCQFPASANQRNLSRRQKKPPLNRSDRIHYAVNGFLVAFMTAAVLKFANFYYEAAKEVGGDFYVWIVVAAVAALATGLVVLLFLIFTILTFPRRNRSLWAALGGCAWQWSREPGNDVFLIQSGIL